MHGIGSEPDRTLSGESAESLIWGIPPNWMEESECVPAKHAPTKSKPAIRNKTVTKGF